MDTRIPPLIIKIMLESNPLKPTMLVGRLGAVASASGFGARRGARLSEQHAHGYSEENGA